MEPLDIAIDVSHAQGRIDWPAVYAGGIRIAMIKATEGADFTAPLFEINRDGAIAAGIAVIPYHFLRPDDPDDQVEFFRRVTGLAPGQAFALDWEGRAAQTCGAAAAEQIGTALAAIAGRPPLGYWGIPGSTPAAPTAAMQRWERWVPRYPVRGVNRWLALPIGVRISPEHWWKLDGGAHGLPRFGQYTSWGRAAGIKTLVDRSAAFFASEAAALAWVAGKSPAGTGVSKLPSPHQAASPAAAEARVTAPATATEGTSS